MTCQHITPHPAILDRHPILSGIAYRERGTWRVCGRCGLLYLDLDEHVPVELPPPPESTMRRVLANMRRLTES